MFQLCKFPHSYVACMGTPGGGNNDIPNRLKRHFAAFHVPLPSDAAIQNIFLPLLESHFKYAHVIDSHCMRVVVIIISIT